ncbi:MAG: ribosome maturation factor RimM [Xanthomonadaceae bacterium]|nr:ribosome maturation factor RimM [Xanthomonadaceae bacterium]
MNAPDSTPRMIVVGRLHGAFGVRGEVKLESHTTPENAIARYQPWTLRDARGNEHLCEGAKVREGGKGLIASLPGIEDRDAADALRGTDILVPRSALPSPAPGEYYWVDLEGLRVVNLDGADFGVVSHLFNNGANDVLVVQGERERMIPFVLPAYVTSVDIEAGVVTVDWDADF